MIKLISPRGFHLTDELNDELVNHGNIYNSLDKIPNFNRYGYLKGICLVLEGAFSFQFESTDKEPHFSGVIGKGDWFGTSSLFIHEKTYYQTKEITSIKLFYISELNILKIRDRGYPIFEFLYYISRELNLRTAQWIDICLDRKEERLLFVIAEIIYRLSQDKEPNGILTLNVTQERLGELCHLSRPKLNQLLMEAQKNKYVVINRESIKIDRRRVLEECNKRDWRFHRPI